MRTYKAFVLFFAVFLSVGPASGAGIEFQSWSIPQGGLSLFYLRGVMLDGAPSAAFGGGGVLLRKTNDGVAGIAGAGLETTPDKYALVIKDSSLEFKARVTVVPGRFKTQRLHIAKELVELDPETEKRAWFESLMVADALRVSSTETLWDGPFLMPVNGRISGRFGYRRLINNGRIKSTHNGLDIAASLGAPVAASNMGRVALVADFFIPGKVVVIDHGGGVFTKYLHLDEIFVEDGSMVGKGEIIGSVGMTGRATGPHLHFSVVMGKANVSPFWFVRATEALDEEVNREGNGNVAGMVDGK